MFYQNVKGIVVIILSIDRYVPMVTNLIVRYVAIVTILFSQPFTITSWFVKLTFTYLLITTDYMVLSFVSG